MDEQLLIDGCKRGEALARKELYELYAPAMMSVCVPVNLVINLWDNPECASSFENQWYSINYYVLPLVIFYSYLKK